MSYLARLVDQSGLTLEGPSPRPAGTEQVPGRGAGQPSGGIEEINLEVPAPTPSAPDAPPPAAGSERPPEIVQEAVVRPSDPPTHPTLAPPGDTPAPARLTRPADEISPPVSTRPESTPEPPGSARQGTAPDPETEVRVTRSETLRRVFEWVAANEVEGSPPSEAPEPPAPTARPETPAAPAPEPAPRADIAELPPAREIGATPPHANEDPPPHIIEIVDPQAPAAAATSPPPEPREERVDITIGAINLTLEAPPPAATAPVLPQPPAPPQPAPPRRAAAPPTADRLRRRFIRV